MNDRQQRLTRLADEYAEHLDSAMDYLMERGIDRQMAEEFGLGFVPEGRYSGRLAVPYHTPSGVVALNYRSLNGHTPKYIFESGSSRHLYNAWTLRKAERALVVEGELKAVVVQSVTDIPTVGYGGTENWKEHFRYCFEGVAEAIVIADDGKPGHDAAERVARSIGSRARVVYTPEGMDDPDTFIQAKGVDEFLALIN